MEEFTLLVVNSGPCPVSTYTRSKQSFTWSDCDRRMTKLERVLSGKAVGFFTPIDFCIGFSKLYFPELL